MSSINEIIIKSSIVIKSFQENSKNSLDSNDNKKKCKIGNGFVLSIDNNKIIAITSLSLIDETNVGYIFLNNNITVVQFVVVVQCSEYQVAILEAVDNHCCFANLETLSESVNCVKGKIVYANIENKQKINYEIINVNKAVPKIYKFLSNSWSHVISYCVDVKDHKCVEPQSGSMFVKDDRIFGMVSHLEETKLMIVPSLVIKRIAKEYIETGTFLGLPNMALNGKMDGTSFVVKNDYGIVYQNKKNEDEKRCKLLSGDKIQKVSGINLNNHGLILFNGSSLPIDCHASINKRVGDVLKVDVLRDNKNVELNLTMRNNIRRIPYYSNKYYNYQGFHFVETSECILNQIIDMMHPKVMISHLIDCLEKDPYTNDPPTYIILFGVEGHIFSPFPPLKIGNVVQYQILILTKVSRHKVVDIDSVKQFLENYNRKTITLFFEGVNNHPYKISLYHKK
jgi:hypothetical protein